MAIQGFEAIAIVAVLAVIFLWGPEKVPDMAKAIVQAKREFDKASKSTSALIEQAMALPAASPTSPTPSSPSSPTAVAPTITDPVIVAAKSLGIITEGKTKEELAKEIIERTVK